ncbi:DUF748 domain-containing protein [Algoriphagus sp.]|uniref:DUF748 domain-containing protein n=1 Tax=Algoriphagus sp. TaxID=1872435 RepID=UPI0025F9A36A|nr:DUF748 domain-containing protein [Algoriphagus sp.]
MRLKKVLIVVGSLLLLFFVAITVLKSWVENKFEGTINSNPERKYDLTFDDLSLSFFQGNIELLSLKITPLNSDSASTIINGSVQKASLEGISFLSYLFSKEISIKNLSFINPKFTLIHQDFPKKHSENSKPFQSIFKDIISRGEIMNFSLIGGEGSIYYQDTSNTLGSFRELRILASGLETDSVLVSRAIPFQLENIEIGIKDLIYKLSEDQVLSLGSYDFNFEKGEMDLHQLSLKLNLDWKELAKKHSQQEEIMEFDIGHLGLRGISTDSRFYDSLMVISRSIEIDSLDFYISKDKNRPEKAKEIKKDFSYLLEALEFPIEVDSFRIKNSKITYSEIGKGKTDPGKITLTEISGLIMNLSSIEEVQKEKSLMVQVSAIFDDSGKLNLDVQENYFERKWNADLTLENMDMRRLNQTVNHLAGISIESGNIQKLHLNMEANANSSDNHFLMQYKDLKMELLNAEDHKKGFLSTIANLAIHKQHQPGDKHYQELSYSTTRDHYKGPINLIWLSAKDGLLATIPTGLAHKLMPHSKESKTEKKEERVEKREERKTSKKEKSNN